MSPGISIDLRNIRHGYGAGALRVQILDALDLAFVPGELTLIVGPSGSGKTTLLSIASGLLRPNAGDVVVAGVPLWSLTEAENNDFRLRHCGFVFQGFNLFSSLTALEQVIFPAQYLKWPQKRLHDAAGMALAAVGLSEKRHLRPIAMSGGEKQRVAIARAIVKNPRFLFADEPTSALDKDNGLMVVELLRQIASSMRSTVVCVTHDPRMIAFADRVITIEDGEIRSDVQQRRERPVASISGEPQ